MCNPTLLPSSRLTRSERGRWQIPVPWDRAGILHRRLARKGFSSTLHLNMMEKSAALELAPEIAPEVALLALIGACAPASPALNAVPT